MNAGTLTYQGTLSVHGASCPLMVRLCGSPADSNVLVALNNYPLRAGLLLPTGLFVYHIHVETQNMAIRGSE